jgi:hypothetical protein
MCGSVTLLLRGQTDRTLLRPAALFLTASPAQLSVFTDSAIAIRWDTSGIEWYSFSSGAIERIQPFKSGKSALVPIEHSNKTFMS